MDGTVNSIEAAYDALLEAIAALIAEPVRTTRAVQDLKNRLDAFLASCDRADELVRAAADRVALAAATGATCSAAADVPPPPSPETGTSKPDVLLRAVQAIAHPDDHPPLQDKAAAGDHHDNN